MTQVLIQIRDVERDQVVGHITEDGDLVTEDDLLAEEWTEYKDGVDMITPVKIDDDTLGYDGYTVEPSDRGYARAVLDELPSPFFVDNRDRLGELPPYGPEEDGANT